MIITDAKIPNEKQVLHKVIELMETCSLNFYKWGNNLMLIN